MGKEGGMVTIYPDFNFLKWCETKVTTEDQEEPLNN